MEQNKLERRHQGNEQITTDVVMAFYEDYLPYSTGKNNPRIMTERQIVLLLFLLLLINANRFSYLSPILIFTVIGFIESLLSQSQ